MTPNLEQLRAEIEKARGALTTTLASADRDLSPLWTRRPAADEWSAKEIAEHVVQNEYFFAGEVAKALAVAAPEAEPRELVTPGAAVDAVLGAAAACRPVIARVSEDALPQPWVMEMTIQDLLELAASHMVEHTKQIAVAYDSALAVRR